MKRSVMSWTVALAIIFSLVLVVAVFAQVKQAPMTKQDQIEGYVQSIDKDTMTVTVRQKGTSNLDWKIVYSKDTQFTYRNEPSKFEEMKEGRRVVCLGKAEGATKLVATRIDIRDK